MTGITSGLPFFPAHACTILFQPDGTKRADKMLGEKL